VEPRRLFPIWPEWDVHSAIGFAAGTAVVLFLPKILGVALVVARGAAGFGGALRIVVSLLFEVLLSAMLAPIRMLFHTQFVIAALTGWRIHWKSPPREDAETTWSEAIRRHGAHTILGAVWVFGMYWLAPSYVWWFLPVAGALLASIPISVYSSRVSLGRGLRRGKLFLIPEEADPPRELSTVGVYIASADAAPQFVHAVVDPMTNAIACVAAPIQARRGLAVESRRELVAAAVAKGPAALTDRQKRFLLADRVALSELHHRVSVSAAAHPSWRAESAPELPDKPAALRAAS
jgi:membrane glycosyltransferase